MQQAAATGAPSAWRATWKGRGTGTPRPDTLAACMAVTHVLSHLRRAVEAALNVGVHGAVLETGRAKIDDLDLACLPLEQHVLRLQVAVHNMSIAQHTQGVQYLRMHRGFITGCLGLHVSSIRSCPQVSEDDRHK